jgi:hypothetical protein
VSLQPSGILSVYTDCPSRLGQYHSVTWLRRLRLGKFWLWILSRPSRTEHDRPKDSVPTRLGEKLSKVTCSCVSLTAPLLLQAFMPNTGERRSHRELAGNVGITFVTPNHAPFTRVRGCKLNPSRFAACNLARCLRLGLFVVHLLIGGDQPCHGNGNVEDSRHGFKCRNHPSRRRDRHNISISQGS